MQRVGMTLVANVWSDQFLCQPQWRVVTVAAQHIRTSYLWPSANCSSNTHDASPQTDVFVGNSARNLVLTVPFCGDKVWRYRFCKIGCWVGICTLLGPRNIAFSTFATANWKYISKKSPVRCDPVIVAMKLSYLLELQLKVVRHQQKSRTAIHA